MKPKVLIYDFGIYCYLAQRLSREFSDVLYYVEEASAFPKGDTKQIGTGIEGVRRVYDFWQSVRSLDKAKDLIFFPDCYAAGLQKELRLQGYSVAGSGDSCIMETDRLFFRDHLVKAKMPVSGLHIAHGIDETMKFLSGKTDRYIKTSRNRGDFETYHFVDSDHAREWFNDLRASVGRRADRIEILIYDPIDAVVEAGADGFNLDGQTAPNPIVGYEIKDEGYVASVKQALPPILRKVNERIAPVYQQLGYRGPYSTEVRITEKRVPFFTDPCCRCGYPPSGMYSEIYSNFGECLWRIARGEMPTPKPEAQYGAEIILTSAWNDKHWLHVSYPKEIERWVKLKTFTVENGKIFCIPGETSGYFGSVVALGKTIDEAMRRCLKYASLVEGDEIKYVKDIAKKTKEAIENGIKAGIKFE